MKNTVDFTKRTVCELPRGENNPRNSEGDFALLKNGDILFAYSRYTGSSSHDDAPCDIAGLISHDNGKSFTPLNHLLCTAKEHNTLNIMSVSLLRLEDGTLCLFYLCKKGASSAVYLRRSGEDETVFGEAEPCVDFSEEYYYVINNCRIARLNDGSLVIPVAMHRIIEKEHGRQGEYFGKCVLYKGDKNGRNWAKFSCEFEMPYPSHSETGLQEPGLITLPDNRLYAYFRTDRAFQFESFSSDNGKNWTVPATSGFTSPASPMLIKKNPFSGKYYAVWNPIPNYNGRPHTDMWISGGRTPFVIAESENGTDFSDPVIIEDNPDCGFCYPAIMFLSEKEMLMSYCCGGPEDDNCLTKTRIINIILK